MTSVQTRPVAAELTETLPARWYKDPEIWQRERWPIFGSNWIHVAYDHQFRNSGDYVTENLAGWPIFIRRTDAGGLTAFYNIFGDVQDTDMAIANLRRGKLREAA